MVDHLSNTMYRPSFLCSRATFTSEKNRLLYSIIMARTRTVRYSGDSFFFIIMISLGLFGLFFFLARRPSCDDCLLFRRERNEKKVTGKLKKWRSGRAGAAIPLVGAGDGSGDERMAKGALLFCVCVRLPVSDRLLWNRKLAHPRPRKEKTHQQQEPKFFCLTSGSNSNVGSFFPSIPPTAALSTPLLVKMKYKIYDLLFFSRRFFFLFSLSENAVYFRARKWRSPVGFCCCYCCFCCCCSSSFRFYFLFFFCRSHDDGIAGGQESRESATSLAERSYQHRNDATTTTTTTATATATSSSLQPKSSDTHG